MSFLYIYGEIIRKPKDYIEIIGDGAYLQILSSAKLITVGQEKATA